MERRVSVGLGVAALALGACASQPDFAVPGDAEARTGYLAAFKDGEALSFAGEYAHGWSPVEQAGVPSQGRTETGGAWGKQATAPAGGWGAPAGG